MRSRSTLSSPAVRHCVAPFSVPRHLGTASLSQVLGSSKHAGDHMHVTSDLDHGNAYRAQALPSLKLITFATDGFIVNANSLSASALRVGFRDARIWTPADIRRTTFYEEHAEILDERRGSGYWLWKPYIILDAIRAAAENEVIMYCDAGRSTYYEFTKFPARLLAQVSSGKKGFLFGPAIPHCGPIRNWTKRDCLLIMDADTPEILEKPLTMTWSLWRPTQWAVQFLDEWLKYCLDARCLTDRPNEYGQSNHAAFIQHRHDQSIASILIHKTGAPFLDFTQTLVHRLIERRPYSSVGQLFYKRPQNSDELLRADNPLLLAREFLRIKMPAL